MPRPNFPPTPAPSADITGKSSANVGQLDPNFALPPAAIVGSRGSTSSSSTSNNSDSSYRPLSPASPVATTKVSAASRKRSSSGQAVITKDDYSLPPPPTRSRKIIQMDPKKSQEPTKAQPNASPNAKAATTAATGGKRKQSGGTTAQGRKIARKTAHSLIERRRRSKMNEEFGVLKDMIPACAGQEMHKLAILQASIDYMRYLENCVTDLKASHRSRRDSPNPTSPHRLQPPPPIDRSLRAEDEEEDEGDEDEDEDMEDAISPTHIVHTSSKQSYQFTSPTLHPSDRTVHSTTTSPNIYPSDVRHYSATASPAIHPSDPHHYSLASSVRSTVTSPSVQASPAFGGQTPSQLQFQSSFPTAPSSKGSISGPSGGTNFALTSPALGPQPDREDHEATEALLMLNTDRRSWSEAKKRGMSVKDLLG
ncbi:hypothetical protein K491DRAFT_587461 [Lophiostoma macrostomum CBS 122681]|uniref:BHLH domain-containing protein n=1 Tax=Lophiostoma macrostomum CBS 122681 TaxID=1314788 RepID=A0A6A6TML8_9PLEO|nr:hypothetical protein K491DRAFT_587461 [Lophiostoma macrostomum CBS 122681]